MKKHPLLPLFVLSSSLVLVPLAAQEAYPPPSEPTDGCTNPAPPPCETCLQIPCISTESTVNLTGLYYMHNATDFSIGGKPPGGCSPCSSCSGGTGHLAEGMPSFRMVRLHNYNEGSRSSLGPGVFLQDYDVSLRLSRTASLTRQGGNVAYVVQPRPDNQNYRLTFWDLDWAVRQASWFAFADKIPLTTVVSPTINVTWGGLSGGVAQPPMVPADEIAVRWSGNITSPVTGNVVLRVTVDDAVRLHVNGVKLIDQWTTGGSRDFTATVAMVAGTACPLVIEYGQASGQAKCLLTWDVPGQPVRQTVPASALRAADGLTPGLTGVWYGRGTVVERVEPQVAFDWKYLSPDIDRLDTERFSSEWTGSLLPTVGGSYTLYVTSDDGCRLSLGGNRVIDDWVPHSPTTRQVTVSLTAGQAVDLRLEHFEATGGAQCRLEWSGPGITRQVIPTANLRTPDSQPGLLARYTGLRVGDTATGRYNDRAPVGSISQGVNGDLTLFDAQGRQVVFSSSATRAVWRHHDGRTYTFELFRPDAGVVDLHGRVVRIADANGNAQVIAYRFPVTATLAELGNDPQKLWWMDRITDAYGRVATFHYRATQEAGRWVVESVDLPTGGQVRYTYGLAPVGGGSNPIKGLAAVELPNGDRSTFALRYDAATQMQVLTVADAAADGVHRNKEVYLSLSTFTRPDGSVLNIQPGRVYRVVRNGDEVAFWATAAVTGDGKRSVVAYLGGQRMVRVVHAGGWWSNTIIRHDRALSWDFATAPATWTWETETTYQRDFFRRVVATTDRLGRTATMTRDAITGQVVASTYPDGTTVSMPVNALNKPVSITDRLGNRTDYQYDAWGNELRRTAAAGTGIASSWRTLYDGRGQILHQMDPLAEDWYLDRGFNPADLRLTRTDAAIDFAWSGSPGAGVGADRFAVQWTGEVEVPTAGRWVFTTTGDDGMRLYVDRHLVVDDWRTHGPAAVSGDLFLSAGRHDLRLEYCDWYGGATARLSWSGPGVASQVVPSANLYTAPGASTHGLTGRYFQVGPSGTDAALTARALAYGFPDADIALVRIEPGVNLNPGSGSVDVAVDTDYCAARFTGQLVVPAAGDYTFFVTSDNGRRLYIDGVAVIDQWLNNTGIFQATVTLAQGRHDLELRWFEAAGSASVKLEWSSAAIARQVIPATSLYAAAGSPVQGLTARYYNIAGRAVPDVHTTSFVYNAQGFLVQHLEAADVAGAARPTTTCLYDAGGRLQYLDEPGMAGVRRMTFVHDSRNRVVEKRYADSTMERFIYGSGVDANLLVESVDRNGNRTRMTYDAWGRKRTETAAYGRPEARSSAWDYLSGTTLVARQTQDGDSAWYAYDHRNRLVATTRKPRSDVSLAEQTLIDAADRSYGAVDAYGRRRFIAFDINDRPVRMVHELLPGAVGVLPDDPAARDAFLLALVRPTGADPGFTITDRVFDAEGRTVATIDARGVKSTFAHDAQSRLVAEVQAESQGTAKPLEGVRREYRYDRAGNRLQERLPRSFVRSSAGTFSLAADGPFLVSSRYNGRNLPVQMVAPDGATTSRTWTVTGKVWTETDARGYTTGNTYGGCCDRLIDVTDALGFIIARYGYDGNGNVISVRDANGLTATSQYDGLNRPIARANAVPETTTTVYDDNLTDGVGVDAVPARIAGLGFGPGCDGSAIAVTDPTGVALFEIHDGLGRLVRRINGSGHASDVHHDILIATGADAGLVETTQRDPLGNTLRSRSDGAGLVRATVDAEGRRSTMAWNATGQRVARRDANGVGDDCTIDALGRDLSCRDTASAQTGKAYDQHGNVVRTTDALGRPTLTTFDRRDRRSAVSDRLSTTALPSVTRFAYDGNGNLIGLTDAEGRVTTSTYDARNLLVAEVYPPGQATPGPGQDSRAYTYDPGRRLLTRLDQAGVVTTYRYDAANRLSERRYPDNRNDTFAYDHAGRLTQAVSQRYGTSVTRSYDSGGRLAQERQIIDGATRLVGYAYDMADRVASVTYPDGTVAARSYTARNQLQQVWLGGDSVALHSYDAGGRLITTTYANGRTETRSYQPGDNLPAAITTPGVAAFTYAFDANKRKTAETDGVVATGSQTFAYDHEDRLTGWNRPAASDPQSWDLSLVGDWKATTRGGLTETRTHSAVHETTSLTRGTQTLPLQYDAKGNLTRDEQGAALTWDFENRLTTATTTDELLGLTGVARYRYDALGRRLQKIVWGRAITFVHDGAQVIQELGGQAQAWGSERSSDGAAPPTTPVEGTVLGQARYRINMQAESTLIPEGFQADKGRLFGPRTNGLNYGWQQDRGAAARVRGESPIPECDTLVHMGTNSDLPASTWRIALPNGHYPVAVVMGDPSNRDQTNHITINGLPFTDPDPWSGVAGGYLRGDFDGHLAEVDITDGYLTIVPATTGLNQKLCFVEIGPAGGTITPADQQRMTDLIGFATSQTGAAPYPPRTGENRRYAYGSYVDEPLLQITGAGASAAKHYLHANHLYSVMAVTNASGAVAERYRYDAYGKRSVLNAAGLPKTGTGVTTVAFTGRTIDDETGLMDFRSRMYAPGLGRYIGRDAVTDVDTVRKASNILYCQLHRLYSRWQAGAIMPQLIDLLGRARYGILANRQVTEDTILTNRYQFGHGDPATLDPSGLYPPSTNVAQPGSGGWTVGATWTWIRWGWPDQTYKASSIPTFQKSRTFADPSGCCDCKFELKVTTIHWVCISGCWGTFHDEYRNHYYSYEMDCDVKPGMPAGVHCSIADEAGQNLLVREYKDGAPTAGEVIGFIGSVASIIALGLALL